VSLTERPCLRRIELSGTYVEWNDGLELHVKIEITAVHGSRFVATRPSVIYSGIRRCTIYRGLIKIGI